MEYVFCKCVNLAHILVQFTIYFDFSVKDFVADSFIITQVDDVCVTIVIGIIVGLFVVASAHNSTNNSCCFRFLLAVTRFLFEIVYDICFTDR